jgi:hypothetical protein
VLIILILFVLTYFSPYDCVEREPSNQKNAEAQENCLTAKRAVKTGAYHPRRGYHPDTAPAVGAGMFLREALLGVFVLPHPDF